MKNYFKMLFASFMMLTLHFQTVFSVNIEYSLTTHVDGREIKETVSLSAGENLEDNMPQRFWRAYTTYKYYSDAGKTQEITTVPSENATLYVDYEFEPPFALSDDEITVWYMLRAFYANNHPYYFYEDNNVLKAIINDLGTHAEQGKWAFYGDSYCLNIKNKQSNQWLGYKSDKSTTEMEDSELNPGWQLYLSKYEKDHIQQFVLGLPQPNDDLSANTEVVGLHDMSSSTSIVTPHSLDNSAYWDDHAELVYRHDKITWCLFFGTIAKDAENIWHVEYRVSHDYNNVVDRYFYDKDVVERPVDYYFIDKKAYATYEYYHDEAMSEPWDPEDTEDLIPTRPNTIVYVMETLPHKEKYVTDHWITIVLPYNVDDLASFFGTASDGETPAVRVLEYDGLTLNPYPVYELHFTPVAKMEANKPYLFKADEILAEKYLPLAMGPTTETTGDENDLITISFQDSNSPRNDVTVSMMGTYDGLTLAPTTMEPTADNEVDYIYFYFGYNPKYDPNNTSSYVGEEAAAGKSPYNFYRVNSNVAIPQNRCYFKIYSEEGTPVVFSQLGFTDDETIMGISENLSDGTVKCIKPTGIYHISGKQMNNASMESLPKGIYIVNGEKVVIK